MKTTDPAYITSIRVGIAWHQKIVARIKRTSLPLMKDISRSLFFGRENPATDAIVVDELDH